MGPALWFERVEKIARGGLPTIEHRLRHALHLLQLAPTPLREVARAAIDEESFEALLEAGNYDTAARHLVASPIALDIDDDRATIEATIRCPLIEGAVCASGSSIASAVLKAWALCMLELRIVFVAELRRERGEEARDPARSAGRATLH